MSPLIVPGAAGIEAFTVTTNVWFVDEPQAFFAVTVMFPLVELATEVIEFVVDVPIQPEGKVQV